MCLVVALAFWILGDTAEGYFCPAVRTLADRWNLAPATAGVTLLALGNGAPDVFASLAAFSKFSANDGFINPGSSSDGGGDSTGGNITLNASETSSGMVGAIVSAGMFVSGAVVGAVALVASPFRVDPGPFSRDVGFYLVGVAGVFLVVMDGRVHPWEAVLLPAYYVVFVVYVVASDVSADPAGKTHSRHKRRRELTIGGEFDPGSRVNNNEVGPEENGSTRAQKDSRVELRTMEDGYAAAPTGGEANVDGIDTSKTDARRRNFASSAPLAVSARAVDALTSRATRWFALRWKEANGSEASNGSGSGSLRRGLAAVWIVCFIAPLEALRRCTIPNASAKKYNAFYATCNVCLSPLLLLHLARDVVIPLDRPVMYVPGSGSTGLTGSSVPVPAWGFTLLVSGCAAVLFWRRFHSFGGGLNDWTPPPWWDGSATLVVSFLCSVAWIAVAATELLGCLTAIGGAIGVSPAALSVSVLAWGNSMGDLASDLVIARGGQPTMAVAACFSGPLFNMMVGLGSAFAMATSGLPVNQKSLPLARHPTIAMGFAFLFVSLVATATLVPRRGYVVTKAHGVGLIALYAVYMVCAVLVEIAYDGTGG
jgi:sodium/potassium/calcium exchanger 6